MQISRPIKYDVGYILNKNWICWEYNGYWLKAGAMMYPICAVYRHHTITAPSLHDMLAMWQYYSQHIFIKACYGLPQ
jgi:hypothetical protein